MKKLITLIFVALGMTMQLFAGATSVSVASGVSVANIQSYMSTAVTAGNTDITLKFAKGGIWGSSSYGSDMTIAIPAGVTKLTLTYDPATTGNMPLLYLASFTYTDALMTGGITIDGLKILTTTANRYLISSASNTNFPASVVIQNSWVEGHRAVFVLGSNTNTVSQVTMTNTTFKSIGVSGIISTGAAANTVSNISITNNTFIDCNAVASAYFIDHRSNNPESTTFNFSNNTVYYSKGQLGNGFMRLTSSPTTTGHYTFNNNLFVSGVSGTTFKFGYGTYTGFSGSGSYVSSKLGTTTGQNGVTFNAYTDNTPSTIFKNPFTFDFTINNQSFTAKTSTGNPALYAPTLTLPTFNVTSSIKTSVGDVNTLAGFVFPSSATISSGSGVTLTATPSYGYTFKEWDDASGNLLSTNNPYTLSSVSADKSVVAVFTPTLIVAWDFNPTSTTAKDRPGDYYYNANNKGVMRVYSTATTPADTSWVNSSIVAFTTSDASIKTCARRSTPKSFIAAGKCRYFQAEFSTQGYKSIQVKSKIAYDNNSVFKAQKIQYSTDGVNYTSFTSISDISASPSHIYYWLDLNGTLPSTCDNQSKVYLRWANAGTTQIGTSGSETIEDFYLTDVEISGTPYSINSASGDFIATTSGDVNTASNWIQWGGTTATTGVAASAPVSTTNLWIPAGITMTNSASATCNQLKIRGTYSAQADMNATGGIVIQSDSTGTGAILDNGNTITGTATVQQYVSGTSGTVPRGWWYLSSPVSNGTASVFGLDASHRLWSWDEPTVAYQEITSGGTALNAGQGYVYSNTGGDATLSFTGTLNTGDITLNLTRTGTTEGYRGYNLIGNPYPSYLDWNAATKTNIRSTIWYRTWTKGGQMAFDTYDGFTGTANGMRGAVSQYIPPMQGFWVKVDADPVDPATVSNASITFHNADRLYKDQILQTNRLRTKAENSTDPGLVRLRVSNGVNSDEAILVADPNASDAADKSDSPKMSNKNPEIPEIFTQVGNEDLVINHLNNFSAGKTLTLGFRPGKASDFSIVANEISNVGSDLKVVLVDNLTSATYDLTDGSAYTFSADATATATRFSVQFRAKGVVSNTSNEAADKVIIYENAQHQIAVNLNQLPVGGKLSVYNSVGQQLLDQKIFEKQISVAQHLAPGVYTVELTVNNQRIVKKIVMQ
jgi:hypothetical protein